MKSNIKITVAFALCAALYSCGGDGNTEKPEYRNGVTVLEYMPAPGQFINNPNMGFTGAETDAAKAVEYAQGMLENYSPVSLGGFGGYLVIKFDNSITTRTDGGYDFSILGNQFPGSSEPGVVWVARDDNGNGLPDDVWYELAGSEHGADSKNYEVTYFRPSAPREDIRWRDIDGVEGVIERVGIVFSPQDSYFPLWVDSDEYTLKGTLLPSKLSETAPGSGDYIAGDYDWGYADNHSSVDMQKGKGLKNFFKILNAVSSDGKPALLDRIDFVKVQTGVHASGGRIGELSTEVCAFIDETLAN